MRKITALLLVLVMLVPFALASCDNGGQQTPPPPSGGTNASGGDGTNAPGGSNDTQGPADTEGPSGPYIYEPNPEGKHPGMVGIAVHGATVEFDDLKIRNEVDKETMYDISFSDEAPTAGWTYSGDGESAFKVQKSASDESNDVLAAAGNAMAWFGDSHYNNIQFNAKISVSDIGDGVSILFCVIDENNYNELVYGESGGENISVYTVVDGVKTRVGSKKPVVVCPLKEEGFTSFSVTVGTEICSIYINGSQVAEVYAEESQGLFGGIGFGTWLTKNSFDNIKVTKNSDGSVLYENDFSTMTDITADFEAHQYSKGTNDQTAQIEGAENINTNWSITDGVLMNNTNTLEGSVLVLTESKSNEDWTDYTLELDARIDVANEGWLIYVGIENDTNYIMWNVGGWGNTKTCYQATVNDVKGNGSGTDCVTSNYALGEWYHIKLVVGDNYVLGYINDELVEVYNA